MTYIATTLHNGEKLVVVSPRTMPPAEVRALFVPSEIDDVIKGRTLIGFPHPIADRQIYAWVGGHYVTVSLLGDPSELRPDMERLTDADEVWVMCFRKPRPGWRLFGRFVGCNAFVGLHLVDRTTLGATRTSYRNHIDQFLMKWAASGLKQPIKSSELNHYVSGQVRDVDKPLF